MNKTNCVATGCGFIVFCLFIFSSFFTTSLHVKWFCIVLQYFFIGIELGVLIKLLIGNER
jgi:hypothetical protein